MILVATWITVGFFSAIGWYGANYYVITPYFPEPVYAEKKLEENKDAEIDDERAAGLGLPVGVTSAVAQQSMMQQVEADPEQGGQPPEQQNETVKTFSKIKRIL